LIARDPVAAGEHPCGKTVIVNPSAAMVPNGTNCRGATNLPGRTMPLCSLLRSSPLWPGAKKKIGTIVSQTGDGMSDAPQNAPVSKSVATYVLPIKETAISS